MVEGGGVRGGGGDGMWNVGLQIFYEMVFQKAVKPLLLSGLIQQSDWQDLFVNYPRK